MLTERITKRFSKHHSRLLAFMDAGDALARQVTVSAEPSEDLENSRALLEDFLSFLAVDEVQHEREEERILLPVLAQRVDAAEKRPPKMSMERMCREHAIGRRLVKDLEHRMAQLKQPEGTIEREDYYLFAEALQDVVWHFRRHIALENSIILPTAERLIPDHRDELWVESNPEPECPDA